MAEKRHFAVLDSLRGVAASLVCLHHFATGTLPKTTNFITEDLFLRAGEIGVYIFFVISGFVIPLSQSQCNYQFDISNFKRFLLKRAIRIIPPSYIAIGLVILEWKLIDMLFNSSFEYMSQLSIQNLVLTLLYIGPLLEGKWISPVFWTLTIEFQYYVFIGLFFSILFKNNLIFIVLVVCLSLLTLLIPLELINFETVSHNLFISYFTVFALGFLAFRYIENRLLIQHYVLMVFLLGCVLFFHSGLLLALASVGTTIIICFVSFRQSWLEFLGKISYSLYLTHLVTGTVFEGIIAKLIDINSLSEKVQLQLGAYLFSVGCAYVFYKSIEVPFIKLAGRFSLHQLKKSVLQ